MLKFLSRSIITLTLIFDFTPAIKVITLSPSQDRATLNQIAQTTATDEAKLATAEELYQEGFKLFQQGTKESLLQAVEKWQQALPLYQAINKSDREAFILVAIGQVYNLLGEKQKALTHYNQALPITRTIDDRIGEAKTLNNIGTVYHSLGEKQKALDYFNQALPLDRALGERSGEAATLNNIGAVYNDLGKKQKALDYYNQALPLIRAIGDRSAEAQALNNIASLNYELRNYSTALENIDRAIEIVEEIRNNIASSDLETSYSTTIEEYYQLKTQILTELKQKNHDLNI